ncbi:MAG: histidine phosphatase family protein [Nitrospiraceae bacterium]
MDCVLVRYGSAVERDEWEGSDADRPLTERGAKRVAQMAAGLSRLGVQPTYVVSSLLIRAIETAKIVRRSLLIHAAVQIIDALLPDAPPNRLLSILRDLHRSPACFASAMSRSWAWPPVKLNCLFFTAAACATAWKNNRSLFRSHAGAGCWKARRHKKTIVWFCPVCLVCLIFRLSETDK